MTDFIPGFQHDDYFVGGIVERVEWGEWDVGVQYASSFGVDGSSTIEGGLRKRPFEVPIIYYGYITPGDRDFVMMQIELKIGTIGRIVAQTPTFQIFDLDDVRLVGVKPGRAGYDPYRGFWRRLTMSFEQLMPIDEMSPNNGGEWSFGNGAGV